MTVHEPLGLNPDLDRPAHFQAAEAHAKEACGEVHDLHSLVLDQLVGYAVLDGKEAVGLFHRPSTHAEPRYIPLTNLSAHPEREFEVSGDEIFAALEGAVGQVTFFHSHTGIEEPSTTDLKLLRDLAGHDVQAAMKEAEIGWWWQSYGYVWSMGTDTWWRYWV